MTTPRRRSDGVHPDVASAAREPLNKREAPAPAPAIDREADPVKCPGVASADFDNTAETAGP
jgi:hypothetical protein